MPGVLCAGRKFVLDASGDCGSGDGTEFSGVQLCAPMGASVVNRSPGFARDCLAPCFVLTIGMSIARSAGRRVPRHPPPRSAEAAQAEGSQDQGPQEPGINVTGHIFSLACCCRNTVATCRCSLPVIVLAARRSFVPVIMCLWPVVSRCARNRPVFRHQRKFIPQSISRVDARAQRTQVGKGTGVGTNAL